MIEVLDLINEWEQILQVIDKFSDRMTETEKSAFLRKYAALCLEKLTYNIEFENEDESPKKETKKE